MKMITYVCENCGHSFVMSEDKIATFVCRDCGGIHRKCYFNPERVCPVPRRFMSGDYCGACTNIQIIEGQKQLISLSQQNYDLNKKACEAQIPGMDGKPLPKDEKKDVS